MPNFFGKTLTRDETLQRMGRLSQVAGVELLTYGDGVERGVRCLEFRTGTGFLFKVLLDRCLDVGHCEYRGMPLSWHSPTGFVGPWYFNAAEEGGLSGFVGMCVYRLRGLSEQERRELTALANFAFYAGTGRKTAMGMGQTRCG